MRDNWTPTHDLALVYVALAYGTDSELSERELQVITEKLQTWRADLSTADIYEIVLEVVAIFLEGNPRAEVVRSMQTLKETLSADQRRRALEDVVQIAEADGVLLHRERGLITFLSSIWNMKATGIRLVEQSDVPEESTPDWSLLHDVCLMYVVMAHSTDNDLSDDEIQAILERLLEWQPELGEEGIRRLVGNVLEFYASEPDEMRLRSSVTAIKAALPMIQRLVLLNDLVFIAESDGEFTAPEKEMLASLSSAWDVPVRLNGKLRDD